MEHLIRTAKSREFSARTLVCALLILAAQLAFHPAFSTRAQSRLPARAVATPTPRLQASPAVSDSPMPSPSPSGSPSPVEAGWHKNIDSFQKLVSGIALIVGGVWAWLKFFRGRTFRSRIELSVGGNIIANGMHKFLKASMKMKNVGLSQVTLKKSALYLDIYTIDAAKVKPGSELYSARWGKPSTFETFQDHGWIEPGEEVTDELLFQLPEDALLVAQLKVTVNSGGKWWAFGKRGTRWIATSVLDCQPRQKEQAEDATVEKGSKHDNS